MAPRPLWGVVAEFDSPHALARAARRVRLAGYRAVDAYTPYPVEDADGAPDRPAIAPISVITLVGGVVGAVGGYLLQVYLMAIDYPIDVGGRPLQSWPAFVPVTFELMVLGAATAAVVGLFALNGLPRPYHPVFHVPDFARASQDRFFLAIEARDPRFEYGATRQLLEALRPLEVSDVPP